MVNKIKYKVICKKCNEECELKLEDDDACGDPECCGSPSYHIEVICPNCGDIY